MCYQLKAVVPAEGYRQFSRKQERSVFLGCITSEHKYLYYSGLKESKSKKNHIL